MTAPEPDDAEALLDYYARNRRNFQPWEPRRQESFYTVGQMRTRIVGLRETMADQQALHLLLREPGSSKIIGECGFTNIVRGPFQACHLGFSLCQDFQGQGLMHEALRCAIDFVFKELALHRVMANYRPENERSHRLLQRLGFEREGLARAYLKIDGRWTDHVLTSLINDLAP
ncbi:MAG: GNAT family N-acetyltransferase [Telluria sp.]